MTTIERALADAAPGETSRPAAQSTSILVVIPALNEEVWVATVVREVRDAMPRADVHVVDHRSRGRTPAGSDGRRGRTY